MGVVVIPRVGEEEVVDVVTVDAADGAMGNKPMPLYKPPVHQRRTRPISAIRR